ncbi:acetoacetate decarboxylase family protein [Actinomycetes bacterium KLBMP 9797]
MNPMLVSLARGALSLAPSAVPRRQRRLRGRHALVDGIAFRMPVSSEDTPALMAGFPIDGRGAARLLPGGELHPLRLPGGRGVLLVTVINYVRTDIGPYIEFSLAIACTHGPRPAPPLLPALLRGAFGTGQYVLDLPVSTEVSVKGGKGIWGMPKHQANLSFTVDDAMVASQYDADGRLGCRIEIDRPPRTGLPLNAGAVNYCTFRGLLVKSSVYVQGTADVAVGRRAGARLFLGDTPNVAPLRSLEIGTRPEPHAR